MMRRSRQRLGLRECRAAWLLGLTVRQYRALEGGEDALIAADTGSGWSRCSNGRGPSEDGGMADYEAAARRIVHLLGEPGAREFLMLLDADDAVRADAFRQFDERGGHDELLDALHDLEADPFMRGW